MSDKSKIEWCNASWNPIRGCRRVSEGCVNCYAETTAYRFSGNDKHGQPGPYASVINRKRKRWNGNIMFVDHVLDWPIRRQKPRRIFVNSMSDLFHENVKEEWIDKIFAVMAQSPQHTFQILTKRPERMRDYINEKSRAYQVALAGKDLNKHKLIPYFEWPLKNVWIGVSVENQATADERIPILLKTLAAIRWISAEPLLGPVEIYPFVDWIVVGGESGKNARPMHPEWARSLRDQCKAAKVAYFFKQWGEWAPGTHHPQKGRFPCKHWFNDKWQDCPYPNWAQEKDHGHENWLYRLGKKNNGHSFDGEIIQQYPQQKED